MMLGRSFAKAKIFLFKKFDRQQVATWLTYVILFLLPWQTRWIYADVLLSGEHWEYGTLGLSAVEVILLAAIFLRGRPSWLSGLWKVQRWTVLFFGTCFISLSLSWFFPGALHHLLHLCFAYALFSLVLDARANPKTLVWSFLLGLIVPSILAWYQVIAGNSPASTFFGLAFQDASVFGTSVVATGGERLLRAYGSFPHPNIFGGYLAVALLLFVRMGWKGNKEKILWILATLFGSVFILTFSRSAWLALGVGLIMIAVAAWRFHVRSSPRAWKIFYFSLLGMLAAGSLFSQAIFTRFDASERLESLSVSERVNGYEQFDDVFLKNPVTGVGAGGYTAALSVIFPGQSTWAYQPVHNVFLLMLAETGLLGFLVFFGWIISIGTVSLRVLRDPRGFFGIGLMGILFTLALFDHYLWSLWPGLALSAFVFGMILRFALEAPPVRSSQ